ncbi:dihydrofolate reductase [Chondrinema litorale]|uniref:dihydrofolate reductase n=1 Tax=Chondrinema litorale TaxID=2994555 RepID=UPI002542F6E0|nr:dihydrofolate reductase [Chondrinema litorale]UZR96019.1 dihydrofolate reductase [Chondrinema litorale]
MIAAVSENNVIGKSNKLIWNLPTDFEYYKNTVRDKTIIMGRKTAESPDFFFSEKRNLVVTRKEDYKKDGLEVFHNLENAIEAAKNDGEVFISGGSEIYKQALSIAERLYITRVHAVFEGDAFFPEFDKNEWKIVSEKFVKADAQNSHDFTFFVYEKI